MGRHRRLRACKKLKPQRDVLGKSRGRRKRKSSEATKEDLEKDILFPPMPLSL